MCQPSPMATRNSCLCWRKWKKSLSLRERRPRRPAEFDPLGHWPIARPRIRSMSPKSVGELEQIQFLLGHVSVQTTERYLGCKQRIRSAVNDRIGIEPTPLDTQERPVCLPSPANLSVEGRVDWSRRNPPEGQSAEALQ